jgi:MYXO-CTERM domain-containing protein
VDALAPLADVSTSSGALRSGADGTLAWSGDEPIEIQTRAVGQLVRVINAAGSPAVGTMTIEPGGEAVWNESANETADAQVITFVSSQIVKDRSRLIAPTMSYLNSQLEATVNLNDECNAYSDGITINFFASSATCENTGRLPDVIFHEFGHSFHYNAITRGAGRFDTALSEGASDYLSATITNDPGTARGFFRNDQPLRHIDPVGTENMWPRDVGEPHKTGIIFAGAMWDLRKSLIAKLGAEAGIALTDQLWYLTLQNAGDIPSSFAEILAADDDDGDLSNGSPNFCEIHEAFLAHGLSDPGSSGLIFSPPVYSGASFAVPVEGTARCPGSGATDAYLVHRPRSAPESETRVPLTLGAAGYEGELPTLADGEVLQYRIEIQLENGNTLALPHNAADPYYERYFGPVTPIYCTDFDDDPFANGWTHALLSGSEREGADDWQWGPTLGKLGSGDPSSAFASDFVIGNDLGLGENWDGRYQGRKSNQALSPAIDVSGFDGVRLQYRRWLNVEDGESDQASIYANDIPVWSNFVGATLGPIHHEDREWRFHDVDLTGEVVGGYLQLAFRLTTDRSLSFGGWTIDDFCIVGTRTETRVPACGDGILDAGEGCDDGNLDSGDGCEATCSPTPAAAICGNGVAEAGEACDDGNDAPGDGCFACQAESTQGPVDPALEEPAPDLEVLDEEGCTCSSTPKDGGLEAFFFVSLVLALGLRRRRRS